MKRKNILNNTNKILVIIAIMETLSNCSPFVYTSGSEICSTSVYISTKQWQYLYSAEDYKQLHKINLSGNPWNLHETNS